MAVNESLPLFLSQEVFMRHDISFSERDLEEEEEMQPVQYVLSNFVIARLRNKYAEQSRGVSPTRTCAHFVLHFVFEE